MKAYSSVLLLFFYLSVHSSDHEILIKSNQRVFEIDIETSAAHWGWGTSETDLFLGYLTSNSYQEAEAYHVDELGKKMSFGYSGDTCLHYNLKMGWKTAQGKKVNLLNQFKLQVFDISTDFEKMDTIYPSNPKSYFNRKYTKSKKPFIDVENQELMLISDSLWNSSSNNLVYARSCYDYVAENYSYKNPLTGFHPLWLVVQNKGADCGNLSSVFITLLRMKQIPARHLMGFRPNGTLHVWADFYLENYGWIPVDVTYEIDRPQEDFFGHIDFEQNGFIVNRGISNIVVFNNEARRIPGLQTYSCEIGYSNEKRAKVYIDRRIVCKEISSPVTLSMPRD